VILSIPHSYVKGQADLELKHHTMKMYSGAQCSTYSLTLAVDEGERLTSHSEDFTSKERVCNIN
jgi:hypothetical protein